MAWIRTREPGKRSRTFDSERGLELLSRGGAPGYSELRIVRMDDHDDVVMDFGATYERRPLTEEEKLEYPHAQKCVFFRLSQSAEKTSPPFRLFIGGSKRIVRDAVLAREIGMYNLEALKKYKIDVVFDF